MAGPVEKGERARRGPGPQGGNMWPFTEEASPRNTHLREAGKAMRQLEGAAKDVNRAHDKLISANDELNAKRVRMFCLIQIVMDHWDAAVGHEFRPPEDSMPYASPNPMRRMRRLHGDALWQNDPECRVPSARQSGSASSASTAIPGSAAAAVVGQHLSERERSEWLAPLSSTRPFGSRNAARTASRPQKRRKTENK